MTAPATSPAPSPLKRWWPFLLVGGVAIGVFANSFNNEFIYDDWLAIVQNPTIRSWSNLWELVDPTSTFQRTFEMLSYRPLQNVSFLVSYALFGLNAGGHHIVNIVLHALSALLVLLLLRRVTRDETVALVGALAFAVHPVHMEAVQVSALRADLLTTPFFLAALLCHLRLRDRPDDSPLLWASLAAASYFLACAGKEMGATVPLVALFLDARRDRLKALLSREGMLPYIGYAAAAGLYSWLRFALFTNIHQGEGYLGGSPPTALMTTGRIFVAYLGHLILPLNIRADYVLTPSAGFDAASAGAWALLVTLAAGAWLARRRYPTLTLGLVWLGATLLPVANLVPIRNPMADRYLYLPSIGFCAIVGWALVGAERSAKERWGVSAGRAVGALGASVLVAWGAITWKQNTVWRSDIMLWSETLRLEPQSPRAHHNLGSAFGRKGRYAEAEEQLKATIRRWPEWAEPYFSLGTVYAKQEKNEQAAELFRQALKYQPSHRLARSQLATLQAASSGSRGAIERARAAILTDPLSAPAHYNLGLLYQRQGLKEEAKAAYREAVRLEPTFAKALNNLGLIWVSQGNYAEAEEALRRAVSADSSYGRAHLNLATLYLKLGSPAKALPHLEAVLRLEPNHPRTEKIRSLVRQLRQGG